MLSIWIFYTSSMLGILKETREFSSHTIHHIPWFRVHEFKKHEKYQNLGDFLTHDNYEQTNGIQLEFFSTNPMLGLLQQTNWV